MAKAKKVKKSKAPVKEMHKETPKKGAAALKAVAKGKAPVTEAPVAGEGEHDEDDLAEAGARSGGGADAALAMAEMTKAGEAATGSLKNFRHHPDIESFYRFIYENDLRYEAHGMIDQVLIEKRNRKKLKAAKSQVH
jgi:NAD+--asparagine ADP-ribosyltransferase